MKYFIILLFLIAAPLTVQCQSLDSIKVVSWNVFLRPGILKDDQLGRVDGIGNYLNKTNADVLVLQEVFHRRSRKRLTKKLKKKFPYHTGIGPKSFFGVPSGVLIFSKHKIVEEKHISYRKGKGSDRLARKGAISAAILFFKTRVQIIGTHLQAGGGKERDKIRRSQIRKMKSFKNEKNVPRLYVGDFNISSNSQKFNDLLASLECSIDSISGNNQFTANFDDHELTDVQGKPKWIDFILLCKHKNSKFVRTRVEQPFFKFKGRKRRLSDHNPIHSTIEITTD
jgi:endonuclease/exonuclease/phosphatase family metal-dependent hydrolase